MIADETSIQNRDLGEAHVYCMHVYSMYEVIDL